MKSPLIFFFCLSIISFTYGQNTLKGQIVDNENQAIEFANVLLLDAQDSSLIRGAVSKKNGEFILENLKSKSYLLKVSYVGFVDYEQKLELNQNLSLGQIPLILSNASLEGVTVTAVKPLYELDIDKMVINVQSSPIATGGTALEVLERSPGVMVDRSRSLLSLVGKEGVLILINGKVARQPLNSLIQMLDGMSADNIEKIELITNPPAKYEAGGNGGIINIQMIKRADLGTNGNYNLSLGYGKRDKEGFGLNLNHRKNTINWYGNFSFNRNHGYEIFTNDRTIGETFQSQTITDRDPISTNINARFGLDYNPNQKTTFGFLLSGYRSIWDMEAQNEGFETINDETTLFSINNLEENKWSSLTGNFNIKRQLSKGSLNFDVDYLYYQQNNPTDYLNQFRDENGQAIAEETIRASKETPVNIWVSRLDYTTALSKKVNLELGLKGISSNLENDVLVENLENGVFIRDNSLSEQARLEERIGAAYTTLKFSFSEKTQMNLGLRYEYTSTELITNQVDNNLDLSYGNFFPTFFFLQKLNEQFSTQFSYGRRITRPTFNDLAPFVIFIDPNTYFFGNTALQPAFSNNYKVDIIFKRYLFSMEYAQENDAIARYQPIVLEDNNQQVFTSLNLKERNTLSAVLSVPVSITDWWSLRFNLVGLSRQIITQDVGDLRLNFYRVNGNMNFQLPKDFSLELSAFYQSESIYGVAKTSPLGRIDMGVRKKLSENSNLNISFNNIFGFQYDVFTADDFGQNFFTNTNYLYEPRIVRVSFSSRFGNEKLKSERRRDTGSEDIKQRVN